MARSRPQRGVRRRARRFSVLTCHCQTIAPITKSDRSRRWGKSPTYAQPCALAGRWGRTARVDVVRCALCKLTSNGWERAHELQDMREDPRRIVIIGGGIAGLCAAVYAQRSGYQTVVLEMHNTAWKDCGHVLSSHAQHRVLESTAERGPGPISSRETSCRRSGHRRS